MTDRPLRFKFAHRGRFGAPGFVMIRLGELVKEYGRARGACFGRHRREGIRAGPEHAARGAASTGPHTKAGLFANLRRVRRKPPTYPHPLSPTARKRRAGRAEDIRFSIVGLGRPASNGHREGRHN